ncbi:DUF4167 domain-containing protein [Methylocella sp.]|uniref:DUF4167 domain-containing protein n=1 Tax=Methylocella sp. TaxID=1978226 RepID=UPI0037839CBE
MRPGQNNKRMRGRPNNNRKGPNPLTRSYESNGPDVKIRGTAHHIGEKYLQLARDAQSSGDPVTAESYLQHAEHYFRIIAQAQAQLQGGYPRQSGEALVDDYDGDDDFAALPDRFASPPERFSAPQPNFVPGAGPQPSADRAFFPQNQTDRPPHNQRPPYQERAGGYGQDQRQDGPRQDGPRQDSPRQDGPRQDGARPDRQPRENQPRDFAPRDPESRPPRRNREFRAERAAEGAEAPAPTLPAFITGPVRAAETPAEDFGAAAATLEPFAPPPGEDRADADREAAAGFHLRPRRRRRTKAEMAGGDAHENAEAQGEARDPVGD